MATVSAEQGKNERICTEPKLFNVCTRAPTSAPTDSPTTSPDYCPRGWFLSGSEWACDDDSKKDLGYGPASWTHSTRCRGFFDKNKDFKNGKGEYICTETDSGALGYKYGDACSKRVTYDEAVAHCASMKARLCTKEEIAASCAERTGCDYDYTWIWTSSRCKPSAKFGAGSRGRIIGPGDMNKWTNRYATKEAPGFPWKWGAMVVPNTHNVIWPETGLNELGIIKDWGNFRYIDGMKVLFW